MPSDKCIIDKINTAFGLMDEQIILKVTAINKMAASTRCHLFFAMKFLTSLDGLNARDPNYRDQIIPAQSNEMNSKILENSQRIARSSKNDESRN